MCNGERCNFVVEGGKALILDMAAAWLIATRHPTKLFGGQLAAVDPLDLEAILELWKLDFRQIRPTKEFRAHLRSVCSRIDPGASLLVRHNKVVDGVYRFAWPTETARTTATAFAAARGLMVHDQFFDMTLEWIDFTAGERLRHMERTLVPYEL